MDFVWLSYPCTNFVDLVGLEIQKLIFIMCKVLIIPSEIYPQAGLLMQEYGAWIGVVLKALDTKKEQERRTMGEFLFSDAVQD